MHEKAPGAQGRGWVWMAGSVILLALAGILLVTFRERDSGAGGGWRLESGSLSLPGGQSLEAVGAPLEPGVYVVRELTVLARGRARLEARPGSRIRLQEAQPVPRVLEGALLVSLEGPTRLGPFLLEDESPAEVLLGPQGIIVTRGRLRAWGRLLTTGARAGNLHSGEGMFTPREEASPMETGPPPLVPAGQVVDASTGRGVAGARVRATAFHGAGGPVASRTSGLGESAAGESPGQAAALDVPAAGTWPPLHREVVQTDESGSFVLPAIEPEDPRLALYLEVTHPSYAPQEAVLPPRTTTDGVWLESRIELRAARTVGVEIVDEDGNALPDLPVKVTPHSERHDLLGESVTFSRTFRLVRADAPRLLHTDESGILQLAASDAPYDFELLHPLLHLYYRDVDAEMIERVRLLLPYEGTFRLSAHAGWVESHVLVDGAGFPVGDSEIEVRLEGMTPRRVRTDSTGRFSIGVLPFSAEESPVGYTHPRVGSLRVLTPEYYQREVEVAFPAVESLVPLSAAPAGRLRLRLTTLRDGAPVPVPADGVRTSLDGWMTQVRRTQEGLVEYRGDPPGPGEIVEVFVPGYLPVVTVVPATGRAQRDVELGSLLLDPGWTQEIRLAGVDPEGLRGAVLTVGLPGRESWAHRLSVEGRTTLKVSGLHRGVYRLGVEGPGMTTFTGDFLIQEAHLSEPLVLPLSWTPVEEVVVAGRVVDLSDPEDFLSLVVESYRILGEEKPLVFPAYPLSPSGRIGSHRRLDGVLGVDVVVVSPRGQIAESAVRRLPGDPPVFFTEDLRFLPRPRAEVTFRVAGLGRVGPPLSVAVDGPTGVEHLARPAVRRRRLVVENLYPGNYTLRWLAAGGGEEAVGFQVPPALSSVLAIDAVRSPAEIEGLEVLVTDSAGTPLEGAHLSPDFPGPRAPDPGVYVVRVRPGESNRFEVSLEEFLTARVEVAPGGVIPTHVPMYRPASFRAELVAPGGELVEGRVRISWEPPTPSPIFYGTPLEVPVHRGQLLVRAVPPLPRRFTLRLGDSDVAIRRDWTFPEGELVEDVGVLRFEETRSLQGTVLLPDGSPGAGATVALVPPGKALRLPFRDGGISEARYSVEADAQGAFEFQGLPIDLFPVPALVARLAGYGDALEEPLDLTRPRHPLVLRPEAGLVIDAGYADGMERPSYGFWLEYSRDPSDPDATLQLGELSPGLPGGSVHRGIEPGRYRVRWGLRSPYEPLPGRFREVDVVPGVESVLRMRIEGDTLRGRARLNGAPVERGWVLITDQPGPQGVTSVGRIVDGEFLVVDPPRALRGYAAVVPEASPQPLQNIPRGEALPVLCRNYRSALRSGRLDLDYEAWNLTIRLRGDFLSRHPGATLHFDGYVAERNSLKRVPREELLETPTVTLFLLEPGLHRIAVRSSRGTLIHARTVDLREDQVVEIRG